MRSGGDDGDYDCDGSDDGCDCCWLPFPVIATDSRHRRRPMLNSAAILQLHFHFNCNVN
jgi:hypothetical protein